MLFTSRVKLKYQDLCKVFFEGEGGVTPIEGLVYMCLPGLWVNLRYFALFMGHDS